MSDIETLKMALIGYDAERQKIEATMAAIRSRLGGRASAPATTPTGDAKPRRKMSAAGRKAISEATKKRWAAFHAAQQASEQPPPKKAARKSAKKTARKKAAVKKAVTKKVVMKKSAAKKTAPAATPAAATGRAAQ